MFFIVPGCKDKDMEAMFQQAETVHMSIKEVVFAPEIRPKIEDRAWDMLVLAEQQYVFTKGLYDAGTIKGKEAIKVMVLSAEQLLLLVGDFKGIPQPSIKHK